MKPKNIPPGIGDAPAAGPSNWYAREHSDSNAARRPSVEGNGRMTAKPKRPSPPMASGSSAKRQRTMSSSVTSRSPFPSASPSLQYPLRKRISPSKLVTPSRRSSLPALDYRSSSSPDPLQMMPREPSAKPRKVFHTPVKDHIVEGSRRMAIASLMDHPRQSKVRPGVSGEPSRNPTPASSRPSPMHQRPTVKRKRESKGVIIISDADDSDVPVFTRRPTLSPRKKRLKPRSPSENSITPSPAAIEPVPVLDPAAEDLRPQEIATSPPRITRARALSIGELALRQSVERLSADELEATGVDDVVTLEQVGEHGKENLEDSERTGVNRETQLARTEPADIHQARFADDDDFPPPDPTPSPSMHSSKRSLRSAKKRSVDDIVSGTAEPSQGTTNQISRSTPPTRRSLASELASISPTESKVTQEQLPKPTSEPRILRNRAVPMPENNNVLSPASSKKSPVATGTISGQRSPTVSSTALKRGSRVMVEITSSRPPPVTPPSLRHTPRSTQQQPPTSVIRRFSGRAAAQTRRPATEEHSPLNAKASDHTYSERPEASTVVINDARRTDASPHASVDAGFDEAVLIDSVTVRKVDAEVSGSTERSTTPAAEHVRAPEEKPALAVNEAHTGGGRDISPSAPQPQPATTIGGAVDRVELVKPVPEAVNATVPCAPASLSPPSPCTPLRTRTTRQAASLAVHEPAAARGPTSTVTPSSTSPPGNSAAMDEGEPNKPGQDSTPVQQPEVDDHPLVGAVKERATSSPVTGTVVISSNGPAAPLPSKTTRPSSLWLDEVSMEPDITQVSEKYAAPVETDELAEMLQYVREDAYAEDGTKTHAEAPSSPLSPMSKLIKARDEANALYERQKQASRSVSASVLDARSQTSAARGPPHLESTSPRNHALPVVAALEAAVARAQAAAPAKSEKRARRSNAGTTANAREVEKMVSDWLDRMNEPEDGPPANLRVHLTTLEHALNSIAPRARGSGEPVAGSSKRTLTLEPAINLPSESVAIEKHIETPEWTRVRPEFDDEEEAKATGFSPSKMRHRSGVEETTEDTSDGHYLAAHKRYETFERRQRIREKEKLQFERHTMRSKLDILRGMPQTSWAAIVNGVLARVAEEHGTQPAAVGVGEQLIKENGIAWLKSRLIAEGQDVIERYDQLLPVESRHKKAQNPARTLSVADSPPPVLPSRVNALRESRATVSTPFKVTPAKTPAVPPSRRKSARTQNSPGDTRHRRQPSAAPSTVSDGDPPVITDADDSVSRAQASLKQRAARAAVRQTSEEPLIAITTASGIPCLIEAANRRYASLIESERAQSGGKRAAPQRTSSRAAQISPFGVPPPAMLGWKMDYDLDGELWWPMLIERMTQRAEREAGLVQGAATSDEKNEIQS